MNWVLFDEYFREIMKFNNSLANYYFRVNERKLLNFSVIDRMLQSDFYWILAPIFWAALKAAMKASVIFDGQNLYEPKSLQDAGLRYVAIGRNNQEIM